ncbi:hypothetical protein AB0K40_17610 [Nonomuraea bangladeshensis]|uniref:Uncharacterized protein n=1 Tax=Nonomuraea bangladeshensis TaxID=404385 RepID=A0ABV3H468_9ACTN
MKSQDSGIGLLLVFGMAIMGLAAMPEDPPEAAPAKTTQTQQQRRLPAEPSITCADDDCWWTGLGRPSK